MIAPASTNGAALRPSQKAPPRPAVVCPWYTISDLSILFGVVDRTIWKWVVMGRLPKPIRKSRKWVRWPKTQVDALLADWMNGGAA